MGIVSRKDLKGDAKKTTTKVMDTEGQNLHIFNAAKPTYLSTFQATLAFDNEPTHFFFFIAFAVSSSSVRNVLEAAQSHQIASRMFQAFCSKSCHPTSLLKEYKESLYLSICLLTKRYPSTQVFSVTNTFSYELASL